MKELQDKPIHLVYDENTNPPTISVADIAGVIGSVMANGQSESRRIIEITKIFPDKRGFLRVSGGVAPISGVKQIQQKEVFLQIPTGVFVDAYVRANKDDFIDPQIGSLKVSGLKGNADFAANYARYLGTGLDEDMKKAAQLVPEQRKKLESEHILFSRTDLVQAIDKWRESIKLSQIKADAYQEELRAQIKSKLVEEAKLEALGNETYRESLNAADALESALKANLDNPLSAEDIRKFYEITLEPLSDPKSRIALNEAEIKRLKDRLGLEKDEDKIKEINLSITKLTEANTFLEGNKVVINGKEVDLREKCKESVDEMCALVARGETADNPLAKMFADYIKDPSKNSEAMKALDQDRIDKVNDYIDSLGLKLEEKDKLKQMMKEWGPRLGFVMLIFMQQILADMVKSGTNSNSGIF